MDNSVRMTLVVLAALGGCTANLRPPDFGPIEYLIVKARNADNIAVATLRETAVRQATAGCKHNHQGFKIQELEDAAARDFLSATIVFLCVGEAVCT